MAGEAETPRCPVARDSDAAGCPVHPQASVTWTAEGQAAAATGRDRAAVSRIAPDRAVTMAERVVETRAQRDRVEEITDLFVRTLGKKLGYGHPLSERTGTEVVFTWTPGGGGEARRRPRVLPRPHPLARRVDRPQARARHHHHARGDGGQVRALGPGLACHRGARP